jgi:hypothetical protein
MGRKLANEEDCAVNFLSHLSVSAVVIFAMLPVCGFSQTVKSEEAATEKVEILSILRDPSPCIGTDHLKVSIMVVNDGSEPLTIDASRLSTTMGFIALINTTEMKFRTETHGSSLDPIGNAHPVLPKTLIAKGFFVKDIDVPIRDPFFNQAGFYKLNLSSSIRVDQPSGSRDVYSSSSAIIELRACKAQ